MSKVCVNLNYCYYDGLIVVSDSWKWMRVQLAGTTFKFNMANNLYYDDIERGFRAHDYLGLYTGKSVRAIGKISDIVTAVRDGTGALTYSVAKEQLTDAMKKQITFAINDGHPLGVSKRFCKNEKPTHFLNGWTFST